jgi:hypothetical protein
VVQKRKKFNCCLFSDSKMAAAPEKDKHPGSATLLQIQALTMDQNPE